MRDILAVSWELLISRSGGPVGILEYKRNNDQDLFLFIYGDSIVMLNEQYTYDFYFHPNQRKFHIMTEFLPDSFRSKYLGENTPKRQRYITQ